MQALFNAPQDTGEVRKLLSEGPQADRLPDLAISDVRVAGEERGLRFDINTSERDLASVKRALSEVFGDKLARNTVSFAEPTLIEAKAKETPLPRKRRRPRKTDAAGEGDAARPKEASRRPRKRRPPRKRPKKEAGRTAEEGPISPRFAVAHAAGGGRSRVGGAGAGRRQAGQPSRRPPRNRPPRSRPRISLLPRRRRRKRPRPPRRNRSPCRRSKAGPRKHLRRAEAPEKGKAPAAEKPAGAWPRSLCGRLARPT